MVAAGTPPPPYNPNRGLIAAPEGPIPENRFPFHDLCDPHEKYCREQEILSLIRWARVSHSKKENARYLCLKMTFTIDTLLSLTDNVSRTRIIYETRNENKQFIKKSERNSPVLFFETLQRHQLTWQHCGTIDICVNSFWAPVSKVNLHNEFQLMIIPSV